MEWDVDRKFFFYAGNNLYRFERMAAKLEEIVVEPNLLDFKNFQPYLGQGYLNVRLWSAVGFFNQQVRDVGF